MKWLANYLGEVSNASYYFSLSGNVSKDDADTINGFLGRKADDTWHLWNYQGQSGTCKNCVTCVSQNGGFRKKTLSQVCHKILAILSG